MKGSRGAASREPAAKKDASSPPVPITPDRRYFVIRGRLWRTPNPHLAESERRALVATLMEARRQVGTALRRGERSSLQDARQLVHVTKVALGERGAPWWTDGAPDYNRYLAKNTPYATWYAALEERCAEPRPPRRTKVRA